MIITFYDIFGLNRTKTLVPIITEFMFLLGVRLWHCQLAKIIVFICSLEESKILKEWDLGQRGWKTTLEYIEVILCI